MSKNANVTKVPYLLDVTNGYFTVFFGEAGMINTIRLYNSATATGDSSFRFICCNQNGPVPKICWITTLMGIGVYGQFYWGAHCVPWWLQKSSFMESTSIMKIIIRYLILIRCLLLNNVEMSLCQARINGSRSYTSPFRQREIYRCLFKYQTDELWSRWIIVMYCPD